MAGRKIQHRQEASELLAELRASPCTLSDFARARGIDGRSLNAWRLVLARGDARAAGDAPRVVELVPRGASDATARETSTLTIHCGPFAVEVDPSVDDALLARVLAAVAAC